MKQLISSEKFTNIQKAQAGLTRLFEDAADTNTFYRVLKNDKALGVLIPNDMWEDIIEDLEAMASPILKERIDKRRKEKTYSADEVKKMLDL